MIKDANTSTSEVENTRTSVSLSEKYIKTVNNISVWDYLKTGLIGAFVVLVALVLLGFIIPGFRYSAYYVSYDPSQLTQLLSCNISEEDSLTVSRAIAEETLRRKDLIEDLLDQGVIVTSEDFASNLSGYYNALIAVLAAVLVILNLFGFFAWRSNASEMLEHEKRKLSNEIDDIDKRLEQNLEEILRKNLVVREKLEAYIQRVIDSDNHLSDDEWDKMHLVLERYKKKEVLIELKTDEEDYDGSIEEV